MSSELLAALLFRLQPILPFRFGDFLRSLGTLPRFLFQRGFGLRDLLQTTFSPRHLASQIVAPISFAIKSVLGGIGCLRLRQQLFHFRPQLFLFFLHAVVAHRFMLTGIGLKLRAIDRHMPQLHQSCPVA
jgi:hypothetical protein